MPVLRSGVAAAALMLAQPASAEHENYTVKDAEVAVPADAAPGDIRRVIQSFPNWTLICDENLKARSRVCNVTQTFVDRQGGPVFSWTLAASEDGKPLLIFRAPPALGLSGVIKLRHAGAKRTVRVPVRACDETTCVAITRLGAGLREQIARGSVVRLSYETDHRASFEAPLAGLKDAVAAID